MIDRDTTGLTVKQVQKEYDHIYPIVNKMTKIKLKCWMYYTKSRANNKHTSIPFDMYTYRLPPSHYIEFIYYGSIDCEDLGGKEAAIKIVETWYGVTRNV